MDKLDNNRTSLLQILTVFLIEIIYNGAILVRMGRSPLQERMKCLVDVRKVIEQLGISCDKYEAWESGEGRMGRVLSDNRADPAFPIEAKSIDLQ